MARSRGVVVVAAGLAMLLAAAIGAGAARAAFPGHNGKLAVQPVRGGGIVLVRPSGRARHVLCGDERCGPVSDPTWSPDGRMIAFLEPPRYSDDGPSISAIYADGSCLACGGEQSLQPAGAAAQGGPSFHPDGWTVTYQAAGHALADIGVDGFGYRRPRSLHGFGPEWSASGRLAFAARRGARRPALFVARDGEHRVRRVVRHGHTPSWAPGGRRLAFVRRGHVFVVGAGGDHLRRLTAMRGHAPAWSPNGRRIAFIRGRAGSGAVMTIGARGHHPRRVGDVRGRSVDWQPRPARPRSGCRTPPDSKLVVGSASAVVSSRAPLTIPGDVATKDKFTGFLGCLRTDGRQRLIAISRSVWGSRRDAMQFRLAGPFVAFATYDSDRYSLFNRTSVVTFELRDERLKATQLPAPPELAPAPYLLQLALTSAGFPVWHSVQLGGGPGPAPAAIGARDSRGMRILDSGTTATIGEFQLDGETVTWTHHGAPRSATLR